MPMLHYARSRVRQFLTEWCAILRVTRTATAGSGRSGVWAQPAALAAAVHAAVASTGSPQTISTGLTQPPEPSVLTATASGTLANLAAVSVQVTGTDAEGAGQVETLPAFTAPATGREHVVTVIGTRRFATVTSYVQPAAGAGTSISLGRASPAARMSNRLRPLESLIGGRVAAVGPLSVVLEHDADAAPADRALFSDGVQYELRGSEAPRTIQEALVLDAVRVGAGAG